MTQTQFNILRQAGAIKMTTPHPGDWSVCLVKQAEEAKERYKKKLPPKKIKYEPMRIML